MRLEDSLRLELGDTLISAVTHPTSVVEITTKEPIDPERKRSIQGSVVGVGYIVQWVVDLESYGQ